jgi:integrase
MPKRVLPLTDVQVRNAKPRDKEYKITDGSGLYLLVTPTGGKIWRFDYRLNDKRKTLSFKSYPEISLADARQRREDARKLVANGVDPGEIKKAQKAIEQARAETFKTVTLEWYDQKKPEWSDNHAERLLRRLELDIFPYIGDKPIADIRTPELVNLLERVAVRTLETAHRLKIACDMVFRYAVIKGKSEHNPAASLRGVLPTVKNKHMAAPTEPKAVAELLRAIEGFSGSFVTKCALQLAPVLFVRPGELRAAEWSEFDLEESCWNIPGHKMKMKQPHLVPLPLQAVKILKELFNLTGSGKYVFPCHRSPLRCMSENTVNASLRRLGFDKDEITGHGFRAMARTMLHEILQFTPDAIEAQLAHAVPDRLGRAYNRTQHLAERNRMMQTWADYLDGLKSGARIIPFKQVNATA